MNTIDIDRAIVSLQKARQAAKRDDIGSVRRGLRDARTAINDAWATTEELNRRPVKGQEKIW